jgi:hypothetical protein
VDVRPAELILSRLAAAGISVEVDGDRLGLGPEERLTDDLIAQVRAFKAALLRELTWDDAEADRLLDAALERIGQSCTSLEAFATDQVRVDLEEKINVTAHRRDSGAYAAALDNYETHCRRAYAPEGARR